MNGKMTHKDNQDNCYIRENVFYLYIFTLTKALCLPKRLFSYLSFLVIGCECKCISCLLHAALCYHCVSLVETNRMISNLTLKSLGQRLT